MSIFIFVSFSSFAEIMNNIMEIQNYISSYTIEVKPINKGNNDLDKFKEIQGVKKAYNEYKFDYTEDGENTIFINDYKIDRDKDIFTKKFKEASLKEAIGFDFKNIDYDTTNYMNLSNKITKENFDNGIILQNKGIGIKGNKKTPFDITNLKVGDKIDLTINYQKNSKMESILIKDIEIVGFLEEGVAITNKSMEYPKVYFGNNLSEKIMKELLVNKVVDTIKIIPIDESYSEEIYNVLHDNLEKYEIFNVDSPRESQREWSKIVLVGKMGVYGFLTLITLITITNIITSVSSSIDNRRKDVALLRSIGTSQKTIKKMILLENLNYFIYSVILGNGLGIISSIIISYAASSMYGGIYTFPIIPIIISSTLLLMFVLTISSYSIKKLCKNSIIEEIREE